MEVAVTVLQWVLFWPATGRPDAPWLEHPDEDAFVRTARRVCELYSESIRPARITAKCSELRFFCRHEPVRSDMLVTVQTGRPDSFEMAVAELPEGIAALPPPTRAAMVLDVIHGGARYLAEVRGWDLHAFDAARQHSLDAGLEFRWEGPTKSSPDRRHIARPVYELLDDGYGRVTVEIRRGNDGHLVAVSASSLAFSTSAGFARSARTLRWRSSTIVELIPFSGLSAGTADRILWADDHGLITVNLDDETTKPAVAIAQLADGGHLDAQVTTVTPPAVLVRGDGPRSPEAGHRITVLKGAPRDDVPPTYQHAADALLMQLEGADWLTWWSAANDRVLEISYDFDAIDETIDTHRRNGTLSVSILRPPTTFADTTNLSGLAYHDIDAMLAAIRRRTRLGPHPELINATL